MSAPAYPPVELTNGDKFTWDREEYTLLGQGGAWVWVQRLGAAPTSETRAFFLSTFKKIVPKFELGKTYRIADGGEVTYYIVGEHRGNAVAWCPHWASYLSLKTAVRHKYTEVPS